MTHFLPPYIRIVFRFSGMTSFDGSELVSNKLKIFGSAFCNGAGPPRGLAASCRKRVMASGWANRYPPSNSLLVLKGDCVAPRQSPTRFTEQC